MSYTNNWVHGIRQTLTEGHSKAELEKLSNEKLKDLHKEYSGKDDDESKKEADMIKDILATRGDAGENKEEEVKEAVRIGDPNYAARVFAGAEARLTGHEKARLALRKAEEAEEAKKQKKETEETPSKTVSESKIKDTVKKLVKKGKKVATKVGKTLIHDRESNYLSRDIKY